jgi:hypothetical protein
VAIKGKSKGGRGARGVARGPKPVYTPVKRPLMQRRGFWVGVGIVVLAVVAVGLFYGFAKQRSEDRERAETEALAVAAREYGRQLDALLGQVGQPAPPTGFTAFPQLTTLLTGLRSGDVDAETATTAAQDAVDRASATADAVEAIDVTGIVQGKDLDPTFVVYLFDSRDDLVSALRLYEQAAALAELAATSDPPMRDDLIDRAEGVAAAAGEVFARGYDSYVEAQSRAGTFQPTVPGLTGPPLTGPPVTGPGVTGPTSPLTGPTAATG